MQSLTQSLCCEKLHVVHLITLRVLNICLQGQLEFIFIMWENYQFRIYLGELFKDFQIFKNYRNYIKNLEK